MALINEIIAEIERHPRLKEALEEMNRTRQEFNGAHVSARHICHARLDGEQTPVTFVVTVGEEESEDEMNDAANDVLAGDPE